VSSIFVNPSQFSKGEDLDKYPRQLEKDIQLIENYMQKDNRFKVDCLFVPTESQIYPSYPKQLCHVEPSDFSLIDEGKARPEFFRGVATIVTKLFNIVQPDNAYFGQKDIAQCVLIKRMVADLNIPVSIKIIETMRDPDGLAMSSRNVYLTTEERKFANVLYNSLKNGCDLIDSHKSGTLNRTEVIDLIDSSLKSDKLLKRVEYISIASHNNMIELSDVSTEVGGVISCAIRYGNVRLIDNLLFGKAISDILS
jgi:pantoate--beta-alanine ligase